jgi:hypothetical protein
MPINLGDETVENQNEQNGQDDSYCGFIFYRIDDVFRGYRRYDPQSTAK